MLKSTFIFYLFCVLSVTLTAHVHAHAKPLYGNFGHGDRIEEYSVSQLDHFFFHLYVPIDSVVMTRYLDCQYINTVNCSFSSAPQYNNYYCKSLHTSGIHRSIHRSLIHIENIIDLVFISQQNYTDLGASNDLLSAPTSMYVFSQMAYYTMVNMNMEYDRCGSSYITYAFEYLSTPIGQLNDYLMSPILDSNSAFKLQSQDKSYSTSKTTTIILTPNIKYKFGVCGWRKN